LERSILRSVMKENGLSAKDICVILKTMAQTGAEKLELGDLKIDRSGVDHKQKVVDTIPIDENLPEATLEEDACVHKKELTDDMSMNDPLEYERLLVSGELEDG